MNEPTLPQNQSNDMEDAAEKTTRNPRCEMEVIEDNSFSYEGYQVVRGEFFSHIYEPSFTFNNYKVSVNTACIKRLPEFDYVQILVNPDEKKLAVKPCQEEEKDSFRWCSATPKRSPKQITCRIFYAKVMSLMGWNPDFRYKLLGKLLKSGDKMLFVFDLTTPEIFEKHLTEDGLKASRKAVYPADWQNQFGLSVEQHQTAIQMSIFDGYAVFGISSTISDNTNEEKTESDSDSASDEPQSQDSLPKQESTPERKETTHYEQTSLFSTNTLY